MKNYLKNHLKILFFCILSSFFGVQAVFERGEVGIFEGLKFDPIEQASAFESHVKEGLFEAERQEEIYREVSKELPAYEKELKSHSELTDKFSDKYVEYVDLYSNLQDQQERGLSDEVINQTRKNIEKTAAELEEYKQQVEAKSTELNNLIKRYEEVLETSLEKPLQTAATKEDIKNWEKLTTINPRLRLSIIRNGNLATRRLVELNTIAAELLNKIKNRGQELLGDGFNSQPIDNTIKRIRFISDKYIPSNVEGATRYALEDFNRQVDITNQNRAKIEFNESQKRSAFSVELDELEEPYQEIIKTINVILRKTRSPLPSSLKELIQFP